MDNKETAIDSEKIMIDNFLLNLDDMNSYLRFPGEDPKKIFSFPTKILQKILPNIISTKIGDYDIFDIDVTIDEVQIYKNFLKIFSNGYQTELSAYDYLEVLCLAEKFNNEKIVEFLCAHIQSQIDFPLSCDILDKKFNTLKQCDRLKNIALNKIVKRFESLRIHFNKIINPKHNPHIIEYCNAPSYVILEILKHDNLLIDSENSVVYFVMYWINYDKENRKHFFKDFLPYFCFDFMHTNYLLTIFPHAFGSLGEDIAVYTLPYYTKALIERWHTERWHTDSTNKLSHRRKFILNATKIRFVCNFNINQNFIDSLKNNRKMHCNKIYTHGYKIYFFFKLNEVEGNKMLSGDLHCLTLCQGSFNIPVTVQLIFVDKNNDNILVLPKLNVSFTQNSVSVGNLILFESIENKTCDLVRDGSLRLKIEIIFNK